MLKPETAKKVAELLSEASGRLDQSVAIVKEGESDAEFVAYRKAIGEVMGALYFRVLESLWREHPDLAPPEPIENE
jgi:hypothetical protein